VVCTSNGSKAVEAAKDAEHVLLGSIVNAAAVAREAVARATTGITIICAGTLGHISLDDALGAGIIAQEIQALSDAKLVGDESVLVTRACQGLELAELANELKKAKHGQLVVDLGFEQDIVFAAKRNSIHTVALRENDYFVGVSSEQCVMRSW
jgi:2-phosphosulfolactate phosphatase